MEEKKTGARSGVKTQDINTRSQPRVMEFETPIGRPTRRQERQKTAGERLRSSVR